MQTVGACAFYVLATAWTVVLGVFYIPLFAAPKRYVQNCGAFYSRGDRVVFVYVGKNRFDVEVIA